MSVLGLLPHRNGSWQRRIGRGFSRKGRIHGTDRPYYRNSPVQMNQQQFIRVEGRKVTVFDRQAIENLASGEKLLL